MNNKFTLENEITQPVSECLDSGKLNPLAKGFSRFPYHICNLNGPWGRQKRWDYWCITSDDCALSITYADIDYMGLVAVSLLDFKRKAFTEAARVIPFAQGMDQPDTVAGSDIRYHSSFLNCVIQEEPEATIIKADFKKLIGSDLEAEIRIARPKDHETLNVLIPWSDSQFQFTSKQNTLPVEGFVTLGKQYYRFNESNKAFATLDYGRGIWPARTRWNWASASGVCDGNTIGLQFGGKWTEGTGFTENGVMINGELFKIGEELEWQYNDKDFKQPWTLKSVQSDCINLRFDPFYLRSLKMPIWIAGAQVNQCFGYFSGEIKLGEGRDYQVMNLIGWAEEMKAKW